MLFGFLTWRVVATHQSIKWTENTNTVDGRNLAPVGLSHVLQGFIHPRWLFGISSINRTLWFSMISAVEHTNLSRLNLVASRTCMLLHSYSWHLSWHKCHRSQEGTVYRLGFFRAGISMMVIAARIWFLIYNLKFQHVSSRLRRVFWSTTTAGHHIHKIQISE